jgi:hypothetical protein
MMQVKAAAVRTKVAMGAVDVVVSTGQWLVQSPTVLNNAIRSGYTPALRTEAQGWEQDCGICDSTALAPGCSFCNHVYHNTAQCIKAPNIASAESLAAGSWQRERLGVFPVLERDLPKGSGSAAGTTTAGRARAQQKAQAHAAPQRQTASETSPPPPHPTPPHPRRLPGMVYVFSFVHKDRLVKI